VNLARSLEIQTTKVRADAFIELLNFGKQLHREEIGNQRDNKREGERESHYLNIN